jgi:hypothetical protein
VVPLRGDNTNSRRPANTGDTNSRLTKARRRGNNGDSLVTAASADNTNSLTAASADNTNLRLPTNTCDNGNSPATEAHLRRHNTNPLTAANAANTNPLTAANADNTNSLTAASADNTLVAADPLRCEAGNSQAKRPFPTATAAARNGLDVVGPPASRRISGRGHCTRSRAVRYLVAFATPVIRPKLAAKPLKNPCRNCDMELHARTPFRGRATRSRHSPPPSARRSATGSARLANPRPLPAVL